MLFVDAFLLYYLLSHGFCVQAGFSNDASFWPASFGSKHMDDASKEFKRTQHCLQIVMDLQLMHRITNQ